MTGGTPALVHPLLSAMCLGLCLSLLHHGKVLVLLGNGEHLPDELELDGVQGLSLYIFIVFSVSQFMFVILRHLKIEFNSPQCSH